MMGGVDIGSRPYSIRGERSELDTDGELDSDINSSDGYSE